MIESLATLETLVTYFPNNMSKGFKYLLNNDFKRKIKKYKNKYGNT